MRARNGIEEEVNKGQKAGEEGYGREREEGRTEARARGGSRRGDSMDKGPEDICSYHIRPRSNTHTLVFVHIHIHIHVLFFLYSICFINYNYYYNFIIHTHASINQTLT